MNKSYEKKISQGEQVLQDLSEQAKKVHSAVLKRMLEDEVSEYMRMKQAFAKCIPFQERRIESLRKLQAEIREQQANYAATNEENIDSAIKTIQVVLEKQNARNIKILEELETLEQLTVDNSYCIYANTLSRDYREWSQFLKDVRKTLGSELIGMVPYVSTVVAILELIENLLLTSSNNGTDYASTDIQLCIIEIHTALLKAAADLFEQTYERLARAEAVEST